MFLGQIDKEKAAISDTGRVVKCKIRAISLLDRERFERGDWVILPERSTEQRVYGLWRDGL